MVSHLSNETESRGRSGDDTEVAGLGILTATILCATVIRKSASGAHAAILGRRNARVDRSEIEPVDPKCWGASLTRRTRSVGPSIETHSRKLAKTERTFDKASLLSSSRWVA